ncbi:MAG: C13 family peptidase [Paludibacteraceae bacterium]|nr:C13 family peptidase [Paludibacteraceae bacterium]
MKRLGLIASLLLIGSVYANAEITESEARQYARAYLEEKTDYNLDSITVAQSNEMLTRLDIALDDSMIVDEPSWFFFIDPKPGTRWGHECKYIAISPEAKTIRVATKEMYPEKFEENWQYISKPVIIIPKDFDPATRLVKPGLYANKKTSTVKSNGYAILISGGMSLSGNWQDGWNEMSVIYQALTDLHGYPKENIITLMSDGDNPADDMTINGVTLSSPLDLDGDGNPDVNYACNVTNVEKAFNELASKVDENDDVFVYMVSHGNVNTFAMYNAASLRAYQLKAFMNKLNAKSITTFISACHSGSFVDDIYGSNRTIITSTGAEESGWAGDIGTFWGPFLGALSGTMYNTDATVDCDANGDGKNDLLESYIYGIEHDSNTRIQLLGYYNHSTPYLWTSNALSQETKINAGSGRFMTGEELEANNAITNAQIVYQSPKSIKLKAGFAYKQSGKAEFQAVVNENMLVGCLAGYKAIEDEIFEIKDNGSLTELTDIQSVDKISIYPNPTDGKLNISNSKGSIDNIVLTDIAGKVLVEKAVNADQTDIDLSSYNKGIYLVKVVTANDSYIEKVVLK